MKIIKEYGINKMIEEIVGKAHEIQLMVDEFELHAKEVNVLDIKTNNVLSKAFISLQRIIRCF